ncbi:MAG: Lipoate-protein ligase A [Firmicutes bacterium ADurb.Bin506]|nr:MAG: Lipoate-protein ligase A [Firmicutes bacterium ADurb.Bin506]
MAACRIVCSTGHNVWRNLALEEHLINQADPREPILYLWRNSPAVVIGRHQNPWVESCPDLIDREGVLLARRSSGGGAVYHDLGNLCFTFLTSRASYDLRRQTLLVLETLRSLGIDAQLSERNDLLVAGKKVSGNASWLGRTIACHHGTLLVDSDLARLARYLQASTAGISTKATESVRFPVANLADARPGLTADIVATALISAFTATHGTGPEQVERIDPDTLSELDERAARHASWEWRFGKTPRFEMECCLSLNCDAARVRLTVARGLIERCELRPTETDAPSDAPAAAEFCRALTGRRLQPADIGAAPSSAMEEGPPIE